MTTPILKKRLTLVYLCLISWTSVAENSQDNQWPSPDSTSALFCQAVQRISANTNEPSTNTIFADMPAYRSSKPSVLPLKIYQVVSYHQNIPIVVSCKVKSADHIKASYGEQAAGQQGTCHHIAQLITNQAIDELSAINSEAAQSASTFILEKSEPYVTGRSYLESYELSFLDDQGQVHLNIPSLLTEWEDWRFYILPNQIRGQLYCHLPTVEYVKALATKQLKPGLIVTTADDAPTQANSY